MFCKKKNGLQILKGPTYVIFIFDKYSLLFQLWPFQFFYKSLNCPNLNSRAPDKNNYWFVYIFFACYKLIESVKIIWQASSNFLLFVGIVQFKCSLIFFFCCSHVFPVMPVRALSLGKRCNYLFNGELIIFFTLCRINFKVFKFDYVVLPLFNFIKLVFVTIDLLLSVALYTFSIKV